jgi:hypothetical protein
METTLGKGGEITGSNYVEHPIVNTDSPPLQRTDEGRIYGRLPTTDRGPRTKRIASKHLYPKYYTTLYVRMAYTVYTLYNTLLQLPHGKRPAIRQGGYK